MINWRTAALHAVYSTCSDATRTQRTRRAPLYPASSVPSLLSDTESHHHSAEAYKYRDTTVLGMLRSTVHSTGGAHPWKALRLLPGWGPRQTFARCCHSRPHIAAIRWHGMRCGGEQQRTRFGQRSLCAGVSACRKEGSSTQRDRDMVTDKAKLLLLSLQLGSCIQPSHSHDMPYHISSHLVVQLPVQLPVSTLQLGSYITYII